MNPEDVRDLISQMKSQHEEHMANMVQHFQEMIDVKPETVTLPVPTQSTPPFVPFYAESGLWKDYWNRFETFCQANNISEVRQPLVFLTNQNSVIFKTIDNFASPQTVPTTANKLSIEAITDFMSTQYDHKHSVN